MVAAIFSRTTKAENVALLMKKNLASGCQTKNGRYHDFFNDLCVCEKTANFRILKLLMHQNVRIQGGSQMSNATWGLNLFVPSVHLFSHFSQFSSAIFEGGVVAYKLIIATLY